MTVFNVSVLTTAQARPMVFPTVPSAEKPETVSPQVTMETAAKPPEKTTEDSSVPDKPVMLHNSKFKLENLETIEHYLHWFYHCQLSSIDTDIQSGVNFFNTMT